MKPAYILPVLTIMVLGGVLAAGCLSLFPVNTQSINTTPAHRNPAASYQVTIRQPEKTSDFVHMDTDIYNIGEVVEFYVSNDGSGVLDCSGNPPSFSVQFQTITGSWATRMGAGQPGTSKKSVLRPGESTRTYRFVTTGWEPERYRLVSDCGVMREIIVRPVPVPAGLSVAAPELNETLNKTSEMASNGQPAN
jgi:hypothetical protein